MPSVGGRWAETAEDGSRSGLAVAYSVVGLLAAVACQTWFESGRFIAAGDIPPMLGTGVGHGSTALWGHWVDGGGAPSYQISGFLPALLMRVVDAAGGSDILAQRVFLTLLFAGVAVGVAYFAGAFTNRPAAVLTAGAVGSINPFVMTNVPNPITLLLLGMVAVLGGLVVRAASGSAPSPVVFAAVTVGASYLVQNPPSVVLCAAWVVVLSLLASALVGPGGIRRALRFLLRTTPWVLALNIWWLVPAAIALGGGGDDLAAVTDVRAWEWTHVRSSPLNVLRLNAGWAWGHREYFPYSSFLDQPSVMALGLVIPIIGLAAPLLVGGRARRSSAALAVLALGLVVLGTGLHPPFGSLNLWLYQNVPGYWMFREPAGKVGVPLVVIYGALVAIVVGVVLCRRRARWGRPLAVLVGVAGVIAIGVPSYPLWTGLVVPGDRAALPSAHVAVPEEWRAASAVVNASDRPGKALVLPLGDYYQMPTTWGFYGADVIARSLIRRPTITRLPGGYFQSSSGFADLVDATESALLVGDVSAARRLLQSLGVSHVLLRYDFDRRPPGRQIADPDRLARALEQVRGLQQVRPSPVVTVYEVERRRTGLVQAYGAVVQGRGSPDTSLVASTLPDEVVVSGSLPARGFSTWSWRGERNRALLRLSAPGLFRAVVRSSATPLYTVKAASSGSGAQFSVVPIGAVSLGGRELPLPGGTVVPVPDEATAVRIGRHVVPLSSDERVVPGSGVMPITFLTSSGRQVTPDFGEVGDCNAADALAPSATGLSSRVVEGEPAAIELRARAHAACVSMDLGSHVPGAAYRLRVDHRTAAGTTARACVWQTGPDRCATLPPLDRSSEWQRFEAFVDPEPGTTKLTWFLYADGAGTATTVTQYRMPSIERLDPVNRGVTMDARSTATDLILPRGTHQLALERPSTKPSLGPFSGVGDCNAADDMDAAAAGLSATPIHDQPQPAVRLRARHHSACVAAPVVGFVGPEPYRVSFDYRTTSGDPARVCLWQRGPDRCAVLPPLARSASWRTYSVTVTPETGTTGAELFLYADGMGTGETVTEYRAVRIVPSSSFSVVVSPRVSTSGAPVVSVEEQSAERYRVRLHGGRGPFTLVLADPFHRGWRIKGLAEGTSPEHVMVDGYANGWAFDGPVGGTVVLEFEPGTTARWARRASTAAGAAAIGVLAFGRCGRHQRSSAPDGIFRSAPGRPVAIRSRTAASSRPPVLAAGIAMLAAAAIALAASRPVAADSLLLGSMAMLLAGYAREVLRVGVTSDETGTTTETVAGAMDQRNGVPGVGATSLRPTSRRSRLRHRHRNRALSGAGGGHR